MEQLTNYINPELLILIPVLYIIGAVSYTHLTLPTNSRV